MEKITKIPLLSSIPNLEHGITNLHQPDFVHKEIEFRCCRVKQVHGSKLVWLDSLEQGIQEADAIATKTANLRIGVFTADCAPLLCAAIDGRSGMPQAVLSIHAGWRGAAAGIQTSCFREFVQQTNTDSKEYYWGIGPTISYKAFEVGQEVVDAFPGIESRGFARFTHTEGDKRKYLLNLPAEIECQLQQEAKNLGVQIHVENIDHCTYLRSDTYPSYRRQKGTNGRILSFISFTN